jgi:hypothetical protein
LFENEAGIFSYRESNPSLAKIRQSLTHTPMPKSKTQSLNPTILQAALQGLEIQRNTLDEQIEEVRALLGHRAPGRSARSTEHDSEQQPQPKRSRLSAAARKRISTAQKKRWAAVRAEQQAKEKSQTKKAVKKSAI